MQRKADIKVIRATWPKSPSKPAFPSAFHKGSAAVEFNIPGLLLSIGLLTTPIDPIGPALSQYWAFVRYLTAITAGPDLRITTAFASLDAHQKMILSDDFGMGLPMMWLWGRLNIVAVCDGRYFIKALASAVGAKMPKTARRGPNKSPDFVLLDALGNWHVVECKGTQSGPRYRDRQMGSTKKGMKPTGGIAQKRSILFPESHLGQRLVCGVSIGVEKGAFSTDLRIIDPTAPACFTIQEEWLSAAKEIATRAMLAKALRLAGFDETATYIAANGTIPKMSIRQSIRIERLDRLRRAAEQELQVGESANRRRLEIDGAVYIGRRLELDLPRKTEGADTAIIQQGISEKFSKVLLDFDVAGQRRNQLAPEIIQAAAGIELSGNGQGAVLKIGSVFEVAMDLKRRAQ